jgi:hypothetical protein
MFLLTLASGCYTRLWRPRHIISDVEAIVNFEQAALMRRLGRSIRFTELFIGVNKLIIHYYIEPVSCGCRTIFCSVVPITF